MAGSIHYNTLPASSSLSGDIKAALGAPSCITLNDVYLLTARIGQELQVVVNEYGTTFLQRVMELVMQALEYLEHYVKESERVSTHNCKLMLELDKLMEVRSDKQDLELELKKITLVSDERGRQRDALAMKVGEIEAENEKLSQQILELERSQSHSPFSTGHKESIATVIVREPSEREQKLRDMAHKQIMMQKLQSGMAKERKQVSDLIESKTIEQRRMAKRLNLMEEELAETKRNYASAEKQIQKLQQEKRAILERNQVMRHISSKLLSSAIEVKLDGAEDDEGENEVVPRFYKKDLLILLEERNKLKQELTTVKEELDMLKLESKPFSRDVGYSCVERRSSIRNIFEESMTLKDNNVRRRSNALQDNYELPTFKTNNK